MSTAGEPGRARVEDAAGHGTACIGTDGRIRSASPALASILGLPADELVGRRFADLVPSGDWPAWRRHLRPDGSEALLLVDGRDPAPSADGADDVVVVQVVDLSAQHEVAERERGRHQLFRGALEGTWVLDAEGRTVSISDDAAALLGHSPADMLGRPVADFVDPEDRDAIGRALARRRSGVREAHELRFRAPDGRRIWMLIAATPVLGPDGGYAGSFGLVTDITKLRAGEQRARRQARQQAALAELGRLALAATSVDAVFDAAVRTVAEVLDAPFATIFLAEPGGVLALRAQHGAPPDRVGEIRLRQEAAVPLLVAGAVLSVPDWRTERRLAAPPEVEAAGIRSSNGAPIVGRRPHGVLGAHRRRPWTLDEDERMFLESAANVLASAIERAESEHEARFSALHDPLTRLPNRLLALDRIDQVLRRGEGRACVVVVDVDGFKRVNEAVGLGAGDGVLCTVAERLREVAGGQATVGRLAGDGFLVLAENVRDADALGAFATALLDAVRHPVVAGDEVLELSASVGVALADEHTRSPAELVGDADSAMQRAKAAGGDRFELYDEELRARALDRLRLERDLRAALGRGEILVAYQPIVGVGDGRVIGVEALARWRHPERGLVPPGVFIPLAEELGVIGELGAYVLRTAAADVARRRRDGRRLTCHVNLSARQAADPELAGLLDAVLADTGLSPDALVLEITETSLMETGDAPLRVLEAVRERGVRVVLDDFGTGYSSLARLRDVPIDGLKVDRSFVAALAGNGSEEGLIVAGIVELSRGLALTLVAEGVETVAQLERLETMGCRYAQGFLLARPVETEALDRLLERPTLRPAPLAS